MSAPWEISSQTFFLSSKCARDWSTYETLTVSPSRIEPWSGFSAPVIILNRVVLPAPFGPMMPTMPPGGSLKFKSSISTLSPNAFESPVTSTTTPPSRGPGAIWNCAVSTF